MCRAPGGATWQAARDELLVREKAHTREGDAIAAARRRLPMVELDGTVEVVGPDGRVPFLDVFQGRDELVVYHSMWYDRTPHQGHARIWLAAGGRRPRTRPGPAGGAGTTTTTTDAPRSMMAGCGTSWWPGRRPDLARCGRSTTAARRWAGVPAAG